MTQSNIERYKLTEAAYGAHAALASRVRANSRVLDVGCASGYFMRYLRDRKRCEIWGIEPDAEAAEAARSDGFRVFETEAEAGLVEAAEAQKFNHIVFGDVLEHIADPMTTLRRSLDVLAPGGTVIASLPNIAFARARLKLALGQWTYEDAGIFDRTHLRFFTVKGARDFFRDAGFRILSEQFVGPLTVRWGKQMLRVNALRPGLLAVQMIFEVVPNVSVAEVELIH